MCAAVNSYEHFKGKDVLSVNQYSRKDLDAIFRIASRMRDVVQTAGSTDLCKGQLLTTIFYEPSTRTSSSFQAAMLRLGGQVVPITDVKSSSVSKGESLADTVRCLECYSDAIVIRHPEVGSAAEAARYASVPVLNAGDGVGEHPTQALLDCFTILQELGSLDGLTITMVGDLKHGRTVHSLAKVLANYKVKVVYVSPDLLPMPPELMNELASKGVEQDVVADLNDCIAQTDVLYVTRVQKERFADLRQYQQAAEAYSIGPDLLKRAKQKMIVMHPLPRVNEIDTKVDDDPRAAYFRQMRNGLYVRMALLALVLGRYKD